MNAAAHAHRATAAPPVLLHDEPPCAAHRPQWPAPLPAPLADLLSATNSDERRRGVEERLHAIGCDWLAYGSLVPTPGDRVRPVSMCTAHADPQWVQHYCDEAYYEVDPRLKEAGRSSLPCTWTMADLDARAQHEPERAPLRRFVADLAATGMRGGAFLVLPGEAEGRRHFVSLLARRPDRRFMNGELLGEVLTLGLCLHEYYTRYSGLPDKPDVAAALSPVQREILGHVARGESDKRIAHFLRISSHAVDYHMRQLRNRFAVHNRVQLAQASRIVLG